MFSSDGPEFSPKLDVVTKSASNKIYRVLKEKKVNNF